MQLSRKLGCGVYTKGPGTHPKQGRLGSAKVEYDYLGLDSRSFTVPGGFSAGDSFTISNPNIQMVKVGINYLFNYAFGRY